MATAGSDQALAVQARQYYVDVLLRGLPQTVVAVGSNVKLLAAQPAEPALAMKRRDLVYDYPKSVDRWQRTMMIALQSARAALKSGPGGALPKALGASTDFALVDDDTIEREILGSRMALAMMDLATQQFSDLRARLTALEHRDELDNHDVLRPHVLAKYAVDAWLSAGLTMAHWRTAQPLLHEAFGGLVEEGFHETNRWLLSRGVRPEIDLRPFIRRTADAAAASTSSGSLGPNSTRGGGVGGGQAGGAPTRAAAAPAVAPRPPSAPVRHTGVSEVGVAEETRLITRLNHLPKGSQANAEAVLGRLNKLIAKHVPEFSAAPPAENSSVPAASPKLRAAIAEAQNSLQQRMSSTRPGAVSAPQLLQDLQQRKQQLKDVASTPVERATIEIVALMFQSILTEERLPAAMRVWFARLQMPVLRVAVGEPDFFATVDHPARRLIDRMGGCVMGFDVSARAVGDSLEKEIRRVVQVIEAYPDTGRRVFQTVLTEFEKFLEHYFKHDNEATRSGVSLAQQVELRETLAVQYTIELRKMLEGVPVQEGVREFLFRTWADVLATCAVKYGPGSDGTKVMTKAAANLIWSASAKVSREERADVIRRLPPLLKSLRDGMGEAGVTKEVQDQQIQALNDSLAAAFTAKSEAIPADHMKELTERLETLEEVLPEDVPIDDAMVLDLSGYEAEGLEVVADGGSMPSAGMLAWARQLQVGNWFMLDYRNRQDSVQLAWQGMRKHLSLFVTTEGRGILFQQQRLAAFLQAGLLVPAQDESLTTKATRDAMAKLDADPERLMQ